MERHFLIKKNNYFINKQIINIPNQKIINYISKFQGNQYNTYYFIFIKL